MPYILKNELVNFYVTFKGQLRKTTQFSLCYEDSLNKKQFKSKLVINPEVEGDAFIDKMGHFKRIRLLEESHDNNGKV